MIYAVVKWLLKLLIIFYLLKKNLFLVVNPIFESNGLRLPNDDQSVKLLLYSHKTLNEADNTAVLTATLKFIRKSSGVDLVNG